MQHSEDYLVGPRGAQIYYQYWRPKSDTRAVIIVVHGAAEHGGRYNLLANFLNAKGYAVAALDHLGHGRSDGDRCVVKSFADYTDTLEVFRQQVLADFPGLPTVLLGHSLGGLISTNFLLEHQQHFAACVLSGPAIKTDLEPPWIQLLLIRVLAVLLPLLLKNVPV